MGGINIAIHEFSFKVDDFNEPLTYEKAKAIMIILTRLLLLDPGTIQTHPDMGVGLTTKYRYGMEDDIEMLLMTDYKSQIDKYLPSFQGAKVMVKVIGHGIRINVILDDNVFSFLYDLDSRTLNQNYSKLGDL